MDEHTWHRRTRMPLIIASLAYLIAYSWRVIGDLEGTPRTVATIIIGVTWAMFIADYLVRLSLADDKRLWFRKHLAALTFAVIPVLRLVRLLRFLTRVPGMKTTAGGMLRTQILVYGVGAALILIYIASLAVLEAERHSPDADITSFGIALWWACVTVTTTGFGDYTPVTDAGRTVGVGLMFGGVALAGVITAILASWVLERAARDHDDEEPATRAQVRALMEKVDALTAATASTTSTASTTAAMGPTSGEPAAGPAESPGPSPSTGSMQTFESLGRATAAGPEGTGGVDTGGADPDRGTEGDRAPDGSGGDARPGG